MIALFAITRDVCALPPRLVAPTPAPIPTPGRVASATQVHQATPDWSKSAHANTCDQGMSANTTCARCKSPRNWDPAAKIDAQPCGGLQQMSRAE